MMTPRARTSHSGPLVDFEFLWELLDQAPEYIFAVEPDGTLVYVNRFLRAQIGRRWSDLAGRNIADLFPNDHANRMLGNLSKVKQSATPLLITGPVSVRGRALQLETLLVPILDEQRVVVRIFGYSRDISERLATERELAEKQRLVADIFENPLIGIIVVDRATRVELLSRGTIELLDLDAREMPVAGRPLAELLPHPLRESFESLFHSALKSDSRSERIVQLENVRGDGQKWRRFQFYQVNDAHVVLTITDVSEQKRFERELQGSEQRYRRLSEAALEGILLHEDGLVVDANQTLCDMIGVPHAELVGKGGFRYIDKESIDTIRRAMELRSEAPYEARLVRGDGTRFWAELRGRSYEYDGRQIRVVAIRDISERKKLEADLLRAQKLESIGVLAGGIAHDFNNLLAGIMGHLSLLRHELPGESGAHLRVAILEDAARRARTLTRRLLTFARGSNPIRSALPVEHLIKRAVALSLTGSSIRPELRFSPSLGPVWADGDQIVQALTNLILNARDAMPEGGTIEIECDTAVAKAVQPADLAPGPYARIRIRDRGLGMSDEVLTRAFDPFFSTKAHGTGLGLATSYSIVKSHDGHISLSSAPDGGTIAELWLPLAPAEVSPEVEDSETDSGEYPAFRGSALVMDDDPTVRALLAEMLGHLGLRCDVSAHGDECAEMYREALERGRGYDVVILDLTVAGGKGGQDTAELLRAIDPDVCAIVSSGYSHVPVMSDYREYGFCAVLSKPYTLKELRLAVRVALQQRNQG